MPNRTSTSRTQRWRASGARCHVICPTCRHLCISSARHSGLHHDGRHVWGVTRSLKDTSPELLAMITLDDDLWEDEHACDNPPLRAKNLRPGPM